MQGAEVAVVHDNRSRRVEAACFPMPRSAKGCQLASITLPRHVARVTFYFYCRISTVVIRQLPPEPPGDYGLHTTAQSKWITMLFPSWRVRLRFTGVWAGQRRIKWTVNKHKESEMVNTLSGTKWTVPETGTRTWSLVFVSLCPEFTKMIKRVRLGSVRKKLGPALLPYFYSYPITARPAASDSVRNR